MKSENNNRQQSKGRRQNTEVDIAIYGKVPPQARELECAVLGAIMLEKDAFDTVVRILKPECFYVEANKQIYSAMLEMVKKGMSIDILTVVEELKLREQLDIVGGRYYVVSLTDHIINAANVEQHAQIIFQKYLLREQIKIGMQMATDAYQDSADAFECLDNANEKIGVLSLSNVRGEIQGIDTILVKSLQRIEYLRKQKQVITGVPSGLLDLDRVTFGWQPTDLIILAARPSVGKTAFALNVARNAALHPETPVPVAIFSLEMPSAQLTNRMLSAESEIWLDKIMRGRLEDADMKRLYIKGIQRLATAPISIDDTPALNIYELRAKARRWRKKNNKDGLIIIDYLQLMSGLSENRNQNREQEISTISRGLKAIAKELEVPVIALSQLSRKAEDRQGGVPQLSDLRESGAIEQDADLVAFMYRSDYGKLDHEIDDALKGVITLKIAKHRNGSLEEIPLRADLSIQKYFTIEQYEAYQNKFSIPGNNLKKIEPEMPTIYLQPVKPTGTNDDDPF